MGRFRYRHDYSLAERICMIDFAAERKRREAMIVPGLRAKDPLTVGEMRAALYGIGIGLIAGIVATILWANL
jgi:hypothetical protein